MRSEHTRAVCTAKWLLEAIGYLELGMIRHARSSLVQLGDPGELAPAANLIRDEAVRRETRMMGDALPVDLLCPMGPDLVSEDILLLLIRCFQKAGVPGRAVEVFASTRPTINRSRRRQDQPGPKHKPSP
jgi:hypothetical protein